MIKVDISNVWGQVSLPELLSMEKEVFAAHQTLTEGNGAGNDFLGWLDLPVNYDKEEFARVEAAVDEMFDVAISLHGTLSGEHGIGTAKAKWMEKETTRGTIEFCQRMRRACDPNGLLNANKITGI